MAAICFIFVLFGFDTLICTACNICCISRIVLSLSHSSPYTRFYFTDCGRVCLYMCVCAFVCVCVTYWRSTLFSHSLPVGVRLVVYFVMILFNYMYVLVSLSDEIVVLHLYSAFFSSSHFVQLYMCILNV